MFSRTSVRMKSTRNESLVCICFIRANNNFFKKTMYFYPYANRTVHLKECSIRSQGWNNCHKDRLNISLSSIQRARTVVITNITWILNFLFSSSLLCVEKSLIVNICVYFCSTIWFDFCSLIQICCPTRKSKL